MTRDRMEHRSPLRRFILGALISAISLGSAKAEAADRPTRIREAAARAGPAVVSIRPAGIVAAPVAPPFVPPLLRLGRPPFPAPGVVIEEQGRSGSGLIVDADRGLVLTTASVLRGSSRVEIRFADGSARESRGVVFGDPRHGLALIEFDPQGAEFVQAEWGDSEALRLGDDVLAVGRSARGELLVSAGIVASERRGAEAGAEASITTDALATPETAGGPLLDLNGRVVGIRHVMDEPLLGESRRGFASAAPASLARAFAEEREAGGRAPRGYLGVMLGRAVRFPGELFRQYEVVEVTGVVPGSPAAEAGVQPGDRILRVDGQPVRDAAALSRIVESAPIGSELTLRIERQDVEIEIRVRTRAESSQPVSPDLAPTPPPEPNLIPLDENDEGAESSALPIERPTPFETSLDEPEPEEY